MLRAILGVHFIQKSSDSHSFWVLTTLLHSGHLFMDPECAGT